MSVLTLTYRREDEWHGEVIAAVDSAGYAGQGSAWFSVEQLRSFGAALVEFPIKADAPISLTGGFWKDEAIDQTHIGLSVAPYDRVGGLVVAVRLATPVWNSARHDLHHSVVAHLRTDYACLEAFRTSFVAMMEGHSGVARLEGQ